MIPKSPDKGRSKGMTVKKQFKSSIVKSVKRVKSQKEIVKEAELALSEEIGIEPKIGEEISDEEIKEIDAVLAESELSDDSEMEIESFGRKPSAVEDILFKLPIVHKPLIGTPKQVQKELDGIAIKIKKNPDIIESKNQFDRIHLYIHGYLINIALKQFPYIKGLQTVDVYQESLIALRFKAIPGFKRGKGMSFLNFAKMCIRRHLITILNASKNRQKDQSINKAVSIDSCPVNKGGGESNNTFANILPDEKATVDKITEGRESYNVTLGTLAKQLSEFEKKVLNEFLTSSSYNEIAGNLSRKNKQRFPPKSVDNALVRIRKKAKQLKKCGKIEEIPLFIY